MRRRRLLSQSFEGSVSGASGANTKRMPRTQLSALVPAGTPDDDVSKLRAAAKQVANDAAAVSVINKAASAMAYLDARESRNYWDTDAKLMVEAVRKIGKVA
jgi:tripartite-type tricarboxylate transporter receptor subunit TctC